MKLFRDTVQAQAVATALVIWPWLLLAMIREWRQK